jgi:hypothetical protein
VTPNAIAWSELGHAYGPAGDTTRQLQNLLSGDRDLQEAALEYLAGCVVHQGTAYSATAPVALAVASSLDDPRLGTRLSDPIVKGQTVCGALLDFIATVGEACLFDDPSEKWEAMIASSGPQVALLADSLDRGDYSSVDDELFPAASGVSFARAVLACRRAVPELFTAVLPFVTSSESHVRTSAVEALSALSTGPDGTSLREKAIPTIIAAVATAPSVERAALALSLGELGVAPRELLNDDDERVRGCAALAPALAGNADALREVLHWFQRPSDVDGWFNREAIQFDGRMRFRFVRTAIERVDDFDSLLPGAVAIASVASKYTVDDDSGFLLVAAFPQPASLLTSSQQAFLTALVANDDLWDKKLGNPRKWFHHVGLPYDQRSCKAIAKRGRV